jgi:hypothetical protein
MRVQQLLKPLAILGQVDRLGLGAQDRDACGLQRIGEFQRRLAAELHDHPVQRAGVLLHPQDFHHMLQRQRFEIEPVRSVVIGRHGFGVAVDHDRLEARIAERETGMAAAIIELDPLPDPVRPAAQDHDLLAPAGARLAFHIAHRGGLVGRIHVGRLRLELGGAGIDALEHRLTPRLARARRSCASSRPVRRASRASVNPIIFSRRSPVSVTGRPSRRTPLRPRRSRGCGPETMDRSG